MIFAVEGGEAFVRGSGINIGHFRYYHLENIVIQDRSTVSAGQLIAYTDGEDHLHFTESNSVLNGYGVLNVTWINPLRNGALTPFVDNTDPVIVGVDFWKQGTDGQMTGPLYGKVDLTVETYDPRTSSSGGNAGGHCGIYRLKVEFWQGGERIGDVINYHKYDSLPNCNINLVYASGSSTSRHIYWATNDPFNAPHNKYWNTKQRKGYDYTVDSPIAKEAMYGEGHIQIWIIAEDIRGNADTLRIGQQ
jgi:hypothetical protein